MIRMRWTAPDGSERRPLTTGEMRLAASVYNAAIDLAAVRIIRRKWWLFQGPNMVMAPRGHVHFHPDSALYRDDFSRAGIGLRGLFIHELCHVWQHQSGIFLPLARHPFCRYRYTIRPEWPLRRYGIEQQAEIACHAYLLREGATVPGAAERGEYESLLGVFR